MNLQPVSEADLRPYIEGAVVRNLGRQIRLAVYPRILALAKERAIALAREKAVHSRRPDHIALAHLLRTERRRKPEFRAAVRSHLRREKKIVLANLSRSRRAFEGAATKIDPSAFLAPYAAMVESLKNLATPIISAAIEDTGGSVIEDIGELEAAFDIASPSVMNYIRTYTMKFAESFEQSSRDALIGILEGAASEGWSIPDIRNAIETQFADWGRYRSEMVARTEIIRASNEGAAEAYLQSGVVEEKVWITAHDDRLCAFCADMDGRVVGVEENFWDEGDVMQVDVGEQSYAVEFDYGDVGVPPLHPSCLLPGTRIEFAGDIIAGYRARYSGPAVELIFSDGSQLAVTPNHMLVTPYGFASAKFLRKGDDIIYCPLGQRIIREYPNENWNPSLIEDVVRSLSKSGGMATYRVPTSPVYFHNDGEFIESDIDIIGSDSLLRMAYQSPITEHLSKIYFPGPNTELSGFAGQSDFASMFKIMARSLDGLVGGLRQTHPFFLRRVGHPKIHGIASVPGSNIIFQEAAADNTSVNPEFYRQLFNRYAGLIETKKIVDIKIFSFHGDVYDLQTASTLYLGTGGIAMSNCRCAIGAYFK